MFQSNYFFVLCPSQLLRDIKNVKQILKPKTGVETKVWTVQNVFFLNSKANRLGFEVN